MSAIQKLCVLFFSPATADALALTPWYILTRQQQHYRPIHMYIYKIASMGSDVAFRTCHPCNQTPLSASESHDDSQSTAAFVRSFANGRQRTMSPRQATRTISTTHAYYRFIESSNYCCRFRGRIGKPESIESIFLKERIYFLQVMFECVFHRRLLRCDVLNSCNRNSSL